MKFKSGVLSLENFFHLIHSEDIETCLLALIACSSFLSQQQITKSISKFPLHIRNKTTISEYNKFFWKV